MPPPISNPALLHISPAAYPNGGRGYFATNDILEGELVMYVPDPLVTLPDDAHLDSCCQGCMSWVPPRAAGDGEEDGEEEEGKAKEKGKEEGGEKYPDPGIEEDDGGGAWGGANLSRCAGCRVVWYCGKPCQRHDWLRGHKYECPIYARLQQQPRPPRSPSSPPNRSPQQPPAPLTISTRVLLRLLLLRKHRRTPKPRWWEDLLELQAHEELQMEVPERREMLPVMAKAVEVYAGFGPGEDVGGVKGGVEGLVRGLYCRSLVNSFSISTTPSHATSTPTSTSHPPSSPPPDTSSNIGNLLDPQIALFNHSCTPNCALGFTGRSVYVYSLRPLARGEEATVAYTDVESDTEQAMNVRLRRKELRGRWFFECWCGRCARELVCHLGMAGVGGAVAGAARGGREWEGVLLVEGVD